MRSVNELAQGKELMHKEDSEPHYVISQPTTTGFGAAYNGSVGFSSVDASSPRVGLLVGWLDLKKDGFSGKR